MIYLLFIIIYLSFIISYLFSHILVFGRAGAGAPRRAKGGGLVTSLRGDQEIRWLISTENHLNDYHNDDDQDDESGTERE